MKTRCKPGDRKEGQNSKYVSVELKLYTNISTHFQEKFSKINILNKKKCFKNSSNSRKNKFYLVVKQKIDFFFY